MGIYLLIKELFVVSSQDHYAIKAIFCTGSLYLYLVQSFVIANQCSYTLQFKLFYRGPAQQYEPYSRIMHPAWSLASGSAGY